MEIGALIDQERYPIHRENTPELVQLMERAHGDFVRTGLCVLPGFLRPAQSQGIAQELMAHRERMHFGRTVHNIYQDDEDDPAYDGLHPRNRKMVSECLCLPYDDIPHDAGIRHVYDDDALTRFVAAIVNGPRESSALHRFADPLGALTVNVLLDGQQIDWHFDQAQFVVVLLLQNAEEGGLYQVAPESRWSPDGTSHFSLHRRILDEQEPAVISHRFAPGTLIVHRGTHSLHRVSRVQGETPRVSVLLAYANEAGSMLSPSVRQTYYGRRTTRALRAGAASDETVM